MTDRLAALDTAFHFHPQTNPRELEERGPLVIASGDGVFVYDTDGRAYLEAMSSLWCASLGFSEQRLAAAAATQLNLLPTYHTFNRRTNPACIELSQMLAGIAPFPAAHISYVNSGSEAVDSMVKAAWTYHAGRGNARKRKIISRDRAYHGSTVMGAALTGLPHARGPFVDAVSDILFVSAPFYEGRDDRGLSEVAFVDRLVRELEALIAHEGPETIAAMIMEPVMGAGGVIVPPAGYFARIEVVLRANDILILSDEVICGFGRTGNWFGCQTFGFTPDMLGVAKALSSGYQPIGAVLMSDPVYQVIADEASRQGVYGHGFTYAGHPVTSAVALETLKIYHEIDLIARVRVRAEQFDRELLALAQHELVAHTRNVGLIGAVELVPGREGEPIAPAILERAMEHGLIIRVLGNAVAICPPLIVDEGQLADMFRRLRAALDDRSAQS